MLLMERFQTIYRELLEMHQDISPKITRDREEIGALITSYDELRTRIVATGVTPISNPSMLTEGMRQRERILGMVGEALRLGLPCARQTLAVFDNLFFVCLDETSDFREEMRGWEEVLETNWLPEGARVADLQDKVEIITERIAMAIKMERTRTWALGEFALTRRRLAGMSASAEHHLNVGGPGPAR